MKPGPTPLISISVGPVGRALHGDRAQGAVVGDGVGGLVAGRLQPPGLERLEERLVGGGELDFRRRRAAAALRPAHGDRLRVGQPALRVADVAAALQRRARGAVAEVVEQLPAPAAVRVDEGFDHPVGPPAALAGDLLVGAALFVEADQPAEVGAHRQQHRFGGQPVASGPAGLLVVGLDAGRDRHVPDRAHVGLVDAHPEGVGGDDHLDLAGHEALLGGGALLGRPSRRGRRPRSAPLRAGSRRPRRCPCGCRSRRSPAGSPGPPARPRAAPGAAPWSRCPRAGRRRRRGWAGRSRSGPGAGRASRSGWRSRRRPSRSPSPCRPSPSAGRAGRRSAAGAGSRGGSRDPTPRRSGPRRRRAGRCGAARGRRGRRPSRSAPASSRRSAPRRCGPCRARRGLPPRSSPRRSSSPDGRRRRGAATWSFISAISGLTTTVRSGEASPGSW